MTADLLPLRYEGAGAFLVPGPYWASRCDKELVVGEVYRMERREERSDATHKHEFAWLKDAWLNLPENIAHLYPSPTHLRKRALIDAGYYDEQAIDAGSNAAALRVAAAFRSREEFSLVIVKGPFVLIRTAKSQSRRAMNREEFQKSKEALMDVVAGLIGVPPDRLAQEAGRAA